MKDFYDIYDIWERHKIISYFKENYRTEIEEMFDWENIHQELNQKDSDTILNQYEVEKYEETPVYSTFVGTVFSIFPSGKYYTPWANSNVTIKEAVKDDIFRELFEEIVDNHELFITDSPGDFCDVLFAKEVE